MIGERWWLIIAAVVCMACMSEAFTASTGRRNKHQAASLKMAKKGVAGSFFNPVPEKDDDDNKEGGEEEGDDIDRSISELMKQRKATPRAKSPSTLGGVPTSKATGTYSSTVVLNDNNCNNTTLTPQSKVCFTRF
mmetsp:Transcript_25037/g.33196  ORF Transcript_25037/g.33196 Transcript_25037/m.33196 type:complete len:135 (+) Transcript_25037:123-527(+)